MLDANTIRRTLEEKIEQRSTLRADRQSRALASLEGDRAAAEACEACDRAIAQLDRDISDLRDALPDAEARDRAQWQEEREQLLVACAAEYERQCAALEIDLEDLDTRAAALAGEFAPRLADGATLAAVRAALAAAGHPARRINVPARLKQLVETFDGATHTGAVRPNLSGWPEFARLQEVSEDRRPS